MLTNIIAVLQEQKRNEDESTEAQTLVQTDNQTKTTFEKLQSIIKGYQNLSGLSFEKAENGKLRYERIPTTAILDVAVKSMFLTRILWKRIGCAH